MKTLVQPFAILCFFVGIETLRLDAAFGETLVRVFTKATFEKAIKVGDGKWSLDNKGNISVHSWSYGLPALLIFGKEAEGGSLKATMKNHGYSRLTGQGIALCVTKEIKEDDGYHGSAAFYARYHEGSVELVDTIPYFKSKSEPKILASAKVEIAGDARYSLQLDVKEESKMVIQINDKQILEYTAPFKLKGRYALLAANGDYIFEGVHGDNGATALK